MLLDLVGGLGSMAARTSCTRADRKACVRRPRSTRRASMSWAKLGRRRGRAASASGARLRVASIGAPAPLLIDIDTKEDIADRARAVRDPARSIAPLARAPAEAAPEVERISVSQYGAGFGREAARRWTRRAFAVFALQPSQPSRAPLARRSVSEAKSWPRERANASIPANRFTNFAFAPRSASSGSTSSLRHRFATTNSDVAELLGYVRLIALRLAAIASCNSPISSASLSRTGSGLGQSKPTRPARLVELLGPHQRRSEPARPRPGRWAVGPGSWALAFRAARRPSLISQAPIWASALYRSPDPKHMGVPVDHLVDSDPGPRRRSWKAPASSAIRAWNTDWNRRSRRLALELGHVASAGSRRRPRRLPRSWYGAIVSKVCSMSHGHPVRGRPAAGPLTCTRSRRGSPERDGGDGHRQRLARRWAAF